MVAHPERKAQRTLHRLVGAARWPVQVVADLDSLAAAIDVVIANRVALRISGEMAQYGFAFVGNGEQTYNRDNDPGSPDVGGASDRFIGGAATLAVLY